LRAAATAAAARAAAAAAEADEAADDFARRFDAYDLMARSDLLAALAAKGAPAPAGRPARAELRAKLRALGKQAAAPAAAAPAKAAAAKAATAAAAADSDDEAPPPPKAAAKAAAARVPAAADSDSDGDGAAGGAAAKAAAAAKLAAARKKLAEDEAAEEAAAASAAAAAAAAAAAKEGASPKKAESASSSSPKAHSERSGGPTLASVADGLRADGLTSSQMVIFIDCTKSNATETGRNSFGGKSLHDVSGGAKAPNPYQHVLSVVGRTLAPFDADGVFPVYGASRLQPRVRRERLRERSPPPPHARTPYPRPPATLIDAPPIAPPPATPCPTTPTAAASAPPPPCVPIRPCRLRRQGHDRPVRLPALRRAREPGRLRGDRGRAEGVRRAHPERAAGGPDELRAGHPQDD
jgi:hypothetical protein